MEQNSHKYQVPPGNVEAQFVDEEQTVLVNRVGISDLQTLHVAEEDGLAKAYEQLLGEVRVDTPLTCELVRHIHRSIFGAIFEWAGRWRTVQISKPGAVWPPPKYVDDAMNAWERDVLRIYPASSLTDDETFCGAVAQIQGEFLAIHPFREGNARTIKLLTNLLAAQTGRPLLAYDSSTSGQGEYIAAAKAALLKRNYRPLIAVVERALETAQQNP